MHHSVTLERPEYVHSYTQLRNAYSVNRSKIEIPGSDVVMYNIPFHSTPLPNEPDTSALRFDRKIFNALLKYYLRLNTYSNDYLFRSLNERDENIAENNSFNYILVKNKTTVKSDSFIFLFHGLNERSWDKYLPWAYDLVSTTEKPVVLFPLAFHMNRAPRFWSDPRLMKEVAAERARLFPDVQFSSFANAALSTRIQFSPNRFLLSGVQTFRDTVRLMESIRKGDHPHIHAKATPDIFGYSIGTFFSQLLMMSNPRNFFDDSRMFLFCGGSTLDKMYPVSKAIIDSEAAQTLKEFYIDNDGREYLKDEIIQSVLREFEEGGRNFECMLDHTKMETFRSEKLDHIGERCLVIPLQKDTVMSPGGISGTFSNVSRIPIHTTDFPYRYSHENPFPVNIPQRDRVNESFRTIFDTAGSFLK
jgi:hypothetical protein